MTANAYDVTVADFEQKVLAASHNVPVLVDFWAEWCQPCGVLKPMLEKLAAEYDGAFILAKVNSDQNQELAQRYGVRGIPAVKAFVNGEPVDEFTGALPEGQVREFLGRLIPSLAEPLRQEALAAYRNGELDAARAKMAQAIAADPLHEAAHLDLVQMHLDAGDNAAAEAALDAVGEDAKDKNRVDTLRALLLLSASAGGEADLEVLRQQLDAAPDDLDIRFRLSNGLALAQDYPAALGHLLEIVRRDRQWNDQAGRKTLLAMFKLLGARPEYEDLVREYRAALARTLN